jgi:hypothetical protein
MDHPQGRSFTDVEPKPARLEISRPLPTPSSREDQLLQDKGWLEIPEEQDVERWDGMS